ncbi:hypothetical protein EDD11_006416 [Mortierella claussenii]|nr:hypothetical protein EDD11_006416 [Mortierella claussenii]
MCNYASPSMSSLASNSASSCSSSSSASVSLSALSVHGHNPSLSCATLARISSRKSAAGQHPLAIVSTFEPDQGLGTTTEALGCLRYPQRESGSDLMDHTVISPEVAQATVEPSPKHNAPNSGLPRPLESKQRDLSMLKSAIKAGSSQPHMIQIKSEIATDGNGTSGPGNAQRSEMANIYHPARPEWAGVAVTSGSEQPISPVTVSRPVMSLVFPVDTEVEETARLESPSSEDASAGSASSFARHEFEKWTPPPPGQRSSRNSQREQAVLRQPHSRLPLPRLLKQRSFNFPFSTSGPSSPSSSPAPSGRSSMENSSRRTDIDSDGQTPRTAASCDTPRSVGPPDPIPPHYQHLQNRQNRRPSSFHRRSYGGELDRLSTGWTTAEGANQAIPATSASDDQSSVSRRSSVPYRHVALGEHPNNSNRWSRLLSSIFTGLGSEHGDMENMSAGADTGIVDLYLQQQQLLLTPSNQQQQPQQQQSGHPACQQQLFFYADLMFDEAGRADSDNGTTQSQDEDCGERRRYSTEDSTDREDAPSFFTGHLAADANLQGELAQEDRRESMEIMMTSRERTVMARPDTPSQLPAPGRIPVSCLALSSPPSYWEAAIKYQGWPRIDPRPEQGQENLPRYTCSVFREGCINRKTELVGNWRPYRRPWKRTFAHLRGTSLRLYAVDAEDVPRLHIRNISLQLAKCEIATDYKQRPNILRIRACDRTILVECKDRVDALTWLEHLQAAANIATSLEDRCMPKFYTLPRAHPSASGSTRSAASSSASSRDQSSNSRSHRQEQERQREQEQERQREQEQELANPYQQQMRQQQQAQFEHEQLQQHQYHLQHQQQQLYLQEQQRQQQQQQRQEEEHMYLQQQQQEQRLQQEQHQEHQRRSRQASAATECPPRSLQRERQMSFERTPRPSQRQRQSSMDQTSLHSPSCSPSSSSSSGPASPVASHPNPFQQLQQVLQNQQEQILMIQNRVQREQRARQLSVQVNENESSSSVLPGLDDMPTSSPPSSSSSSRRSTFRRSRPSSTSRSPPQSPPRSPSQSLAHSRRTTATTAPTATTAVVTRQEEDRIVRSVLQGLGQSSDSGSWNQDSDAEDQETDVFESCSQLAATRPQRYQMSTSASSNSPPSSLSGPRRAESDHQDRRYSNQEVASTNTVARAGRSMDHHDEGQEWERTRFASAQQQQQLQQLQQYHEQQQQEQQEQQRQRRQRASWNRRLFGSLWDQPDQGASHGRGHGQHGHDHGHGHGQLAQQPLAVATSI